MTTAVIEISTCSKCPHWKSEQVHTADSWEYVEKWTCHHGTKVKIIAGYHERGDNDVIPKWCPLIKVEQAVYVQAAGRVKRSNEGQWELIRSHLICANSTNQVVIDRKYDIEDVYQGRAELQAAQSYSKIVRDHVEKAITIVREILSKDD